MSWNDFYRRRNALLATLDWCERNPGEAIPFFDLTGIDEAFIDRADLLRAMQYRWLLLLAPRIELALDQAARRPDLDRVGAVSGAWHELADAEPTLRRVLDQYAEVEEEGLRRPAAAEQRLLALAAGLVEPDEPAEDIVRIGAGFLAMVREQQPERVEMQPCASLWRRRPVTALLRRLMTA
ncbi:hypothetical protein GCM10012275_26740 [Longimycelium tulufanense]|uniref:Uncharacterized protein n=1 Tax=Longimycelium tulufanense TaxID=907463 RepID=A0A8J3C871_9PSEU|nr:hypothetical protein [Longimycelium tulufanense]GGM54279.1 hypothetical protein GCM10012275_26740 [Longimycelium tulufanense]